MEDTLHVLAIVPWVVLLILMVIDVVRGAGWK